MALTRYNPQIDCPTTRLTSADAETHVSWPVTQVAPAPPWFSGALTSMLQAANNMLGDKSGVGIDVSENTASDFVTIKLRLGRYIFADMDHRATDKFRSFAAVAAMTDALGDKPKTNKAATVLRRLADAIEAIDNSES